MADGRSSPSGSSGGEAHPGRHLEGPRTIPRLPEVYAVAFTEGRDARPVDL